MGYDFNADEVFRIAEEIERNGADFYNRAAAKVSDDSLHGLFMELASLEKEHQKVFTSMRAGLSARERESSTFDPASEGAQYLQALAGISVIDDKTKEAFGLIEGLSGKEGLRSALKAAIGLEKESVVFYLGMKDFVPDSQGREKLDGILKEEMRHIRMLGARLVSMKE